MTGKTFPVFPPHAQPAYSVWICRPTSAGIPMIKMRRSNDRLVFIMGIAILVRQHLYTESFPGKFICTEIIFIGYWFDGCSKVEYSISYKPIFTYIPQGCFTAVMALVLWLGWLSKIHGIIHVSQHGFSNKAFDWPGACATGQSDARSENLCLLMASTWNFVVFQASGLMWTSIRILRLRTGISFFIDWCRV